MRKRMRWVVLSVIAVAMIVVGIYVSLRFVTEQNLAARLAQAKRPAAIDAYEKLAAELDGKEGAADDLRSEQEDTTGTDLFPADAKDIIAGYRHLLFVSLEPVLEKDAAWEKSPQEWTEEERLEVERFLAANQELVREIRQMAERGGPIQRLDFSILSEMDLSFFERLRSCTRLLRADAVIKAAEGDNLEAVEDIIAGMKLGNALAQEPLVISQLVRIAVYGVMTDAVQDCFDGSDFSQELVRRLVTHIAQGDNRHAFAESMAGERYTGIEAFSMFRSNTPETFNGGVIRLWLDMDESRYLELMNRTVSVAELPYYEAAPELEHIEKEIDNLSFFHFNSTILLPSVPRLSRVQARHEATLDLMQMGIMIEQHHAREGSYPENLDAIAPDLGGDLPVDPFTGEAYQYCLSEDGFLLYSVGQNLSDDGGRHHWRDGDWVWRGREEQ